MSISPVISNMMKPVYRTCAKASEWSLHGFLKLDKQLEKGAKNPAEYASEMLVLSIVSKDLVGCLLYTTQSWYNKAIPEKKRKFVAAVDFMNGIVMVGGQFIIGKIIDSKVTPKIISKKLTGILESKNGDKTLANNKALFASDNLLELTKEAIKNRRSELEELGVKFETKADNVEALDHFSKKVIKEIGESSKLVGAYKLGANILIAAIATTALTKRTLAPLISTPMATWFDNRFLEKKGKKGAEVKPNEQTKSDNFVKQENKVDNKANPAFTKFQSK